MSDKPRNWDKELAAIDKVMARTPATPTGQAAPAEREPAALPAVSRRAVFTTWLRVLLGLTLAIGMTQWPYSNGCGLNLFFYLGAAMVVAVAGVWSAISSWYRRLGWAHTLSLLVVVWGIFLAGREVLPRVGYAKHLAYWTCP